MYHVIQRLAASSGDPLHIELRTLKRRLHERHLLVTIDEQRGRLDVRKTVQGKRTPVLHLHRDTLFPPEASQSSHSTHDGGASDESDRDGRPAPSTDERECPADVPRSATDMDASPVGQLGTQSEGPVGVSEVTIEGEAGALTPRTISTSRLPCSMPGHDRLWTNSAGEYVCSACHPRASAARCQGWPEVNRAPIEARHERLVAAAARELTAIYLALKDAGDRVCVRRQRYAA
jgi:hypothetical protein